MCSFSVFEFYSNSIVTDWDTGSSVNYEPLSISFCFNIYNGPNKTVCKYYNNKPSLIKPFNQSYGFLIVSGNQGGV